MVNIKREALLRNRQWQFAIQQQPLCFIFKGTSGFSVVALGHNSLSTANREMSGEVFADKSIISEDGLFD